MYSNRISQRLGANEPGALPIRFVLIAVFIALVSSTVVALDGDVQIHDPSTLAEDGGVFYTFGTGGLPMLYSQDGWTWHRGSPALQGLPGGRPSQEILELGGNNSWAPDIIHVNGRYYMYYSAPGAQPKSAIGLMINTTLDPESPDYKWVDGGPVVWSDGQEFLNAIDPGVFLDPTDGRLWMVYGSYFGYIKQVELDPNTGLRVNPDAEPTNVAINCEAPIMIHRDGWYYLLANHGSCCQGSNSSYNIRMGRSRSVNGPFIDNMGIDMMQGGGKLFLTSEGNTVGPGHFGLIELGDGVQKFSCHYEADLDRGGISVLDIRPLLWEDGWPVAGDNFTAGTYQIESVRTGTALELAVEGVPVGGRRRPRFGRGTVEREPIPPQDADQVSQDWPEGRVEARMANYMSQAQQKWAFTPVPEAGGHLGSPYFKITVAGTDRTLAATENAEVTVLPAFTGAAEQLWQLDQLTDGTWRIMPSGISGLDKSLALSAVGSSFATLSEFDPDSEKHRWHIKAP